MDFLHTPTNKIEEEKTWHGQDIQVSELTVQPVSQ